MHTYFEESTQWTKKGMKGFFFKKKECTKHRDVD